MKYLAITLLSTVLVFASLQSSETKLTPSELETQNQANVTLIDTLSLKAGYSNAFTKRTDDNGGVTGISEPANDGSAIALRVVFNNGYIPYFKPYVDFATLLHSDRDFYIPSVGLRHDFELDKKWIEPYASFGVGYTFLDVKESPRVGSTAFEDATSSANLTLESGVDFYISDNFALDLSLRYDIYNATTTIAGNSQLTTLYDTSSLSLLFGIVYRFGDNNINADDDRDSVVNIKDYCPNTPMNSEVDGFGCAKDSDKDGVVNIFDKCPGTIKSAPVDEMGCALDRDQDGVIALYDRCSNTLRNAKVDLFGCALDSDKDGVIDLFDECANTKRGAPVDNKGCALDRDKDGVIALYDRCPNTIGGVPVTECGCPPYKFDFSLSYEFNKHTIDNLLQATTFNVVKFLSKHTNYNVRITGYADSIGSDKVNNEISKKRALGAKKYLIDKGIDKERISIFSYGKKDNIVDNLTEENRTKNRRIFVELYRTDKRLVK